jgi:hypothetical protein
MSESITVIESTFYRPADLVATMRLKGAQELSDRE